MAGTKKTTKKAAPKKRAADHLSDPDRTPRRLKSMEPDLTVVVGGVEFFHYKCVLCIASEFFDNALAAGMKESDQGRLEFPDKDPNEWMLVYNFLDPLHYGLHNKGTPVSSLITGENALPLATWFDFLGLHEFISTCDDVLLESVRPPVILQEQPNIAFEHWWGKWEECRHLQHCLPTYKLQLVVNMQGAIYDYDPCCSLFKKALLDDDVGDDMWEEFQEFTPFPKDMVDELPRETIVNSALFDYLARHFADK